VFKAHRLLYHSSLGLRVIKKRRSEKRCVIALHACLERSLQRLPFLQGYLAHKKQPPTRTLQ